MYFGASALAAQALQVVPFRSSAFAGVVRDKKGSDDDDSQKHELDKASDAQIGEGVSKRISTQDDRASGVDADKLGEIHAFIVSEKTK